MELVKCLKPFRNISDLFSTSLPTLSLIPLMKTYIRKNCNVSTEDDDKIKQIKDAVLRKLDVRFPVTDDIKLHQLLDPSTKDLMPRVESTVVLEQAVKSATDRGFMTPSLPRMPANAAAGAGAESEDDVDHRTAAGAGAESEDDVDHTAVKRK